jgi:hypothetical protein
VRFNRVVEVLALGFCVFAAAVETPRTAAAQMPDSQVVQIELTEAEVQAYIAAQEDLERIIFRLPEDRSNMPDVKSRAQVEDILRRHSFASLDAYNAVAGNVELVLEGVDPVTRTYIGAKTVLKRQLASLEADWSATGDEKRAVAAKLNTELRAIVDIKFPGNIDVVVRNLDAIMANSPFARGNEQ